MSIVKLKRTTNYTKEECWRLINVIDCYKDIVENKKTDAVTWQEKKRTWDVIAVEFNAGTTSKRTAEQLRTVKTGGGPYESYEWDPMLAKIRSMIELSCVGTSATSDSDVIVGVAEVTNEVRLAEQVLFETADNMDTVAVYDHGLNDEPNVVNENDHNWGSYSPANLQLPKHPALVVKAGDDNVQNEACTPNTARVNLKRRRPQHTPSKCHCQQAVNRLNHGWKLKRIILY